MLVDLARLFDEHESGGRVSIEYETRLYLGRLGR
jgi:hypothetical protein